MAGCPRAAHLGGVLAGVDSQPSAGGRLVGILAGNAQHGTHYDKTGCSAGSVCPGLAVFRQLRAGVAGVRPGRAGRDSAGSDIVEKSVSNTDVSSSFLMYIYNLSYLSRARAVNRQRFVVILIFQRLSFKKQKVSRLFGWTNLQRPAMYFCTIQLL